MKTLTNEQLVMISGGKMDAVDKHNLCLILSFAGAAIGLVTMVNPAVAAIYAIAGGVGGFAAIIGELTC